MNATPRDNREITLRTIALCLVAVGCAAQTVSPPSGGGGGGGGATIPSTTNLIKGDGAGNGADAGIAPTTVVKGAASLTTSGQIPMQNGTNGTLGNSGINDNGTTVSIPSENLTIGGTLPVGAPAHSFGLGGNYYINSALAPTIGSELLTNGNFATGDLTGWVVSPSMSWTNVGDQAVGQVTGGQLSQPTGMSGLVLVSFTIATAGLVDLEVYDDDNFYFQINPGSGDTGAFGPFIMAAGDINFYLDGTGWAIASVSAKPYTPAVTAPPYPSFLTFSNGLEPSLGLEFRFADQNLCIGFDSCQYNTGIGVTATGFQAADNNTGIGVTATGFQAADNNTGTGVTATGFQAAYSNTGSYVTATGSNAAINNTGSQVTATGFQAAYNNTGSDVTATGYNAAYNNTGSDVTATGYNAAINNTGSDVTATGSNAAINNTGSQVTATGFEAAYSNTGSYVTATGFQAANNNTGSYVTATGSNAAYNNTGSQVTATGFQAAYSNTGSYVTATGFDAAGSKTAGDNDVFDTLEDVMIGTQKAIDNSVVLGASTSISGKTAINNSGGSQLTNIIAINGTATDSNQSVIGNPSTLTAEVFGLLTPSLGYATATNCASGASPAVCGSAPAGSVAIPTGVSTVSLVVDTTAVTANSQILLTADDTVGTRLSVTCNSTLATLVGGMAITARTAGTSFTITFNGTIATNPLCVSYSIIN